MPMRMDAETAQKQSEMHAMMSAKFGELADESVAYAIDAVEMGDEYAAGLYAHQSVTLRKLAYRHARIASACQKVREGMNSLVMLLNN